MLHNQWDSATPLPNGVGMHRALTGSRLVYVEGGRGHVLLAGGSPCALGTAHDYLKTGQLPARDLTCPPAPPAEPAADGSTR
jgi:hypothetical protein